MIIISFEMFYLTIQLRFTKLCPYFWWYQCAICTYFYRFFTLQLLIEIYSHLANLLKICSLVWNIPISDCEDACSKETFSSSQNLFCLLYLLDFGCGLLLHIFENCRIFSQVLHFLLSAGQDLVECGFPPHLVHMLLL